MVWRGYRRKACGSRLVPLLWCTAMVAAVCAGCHGAPQPKPLEQLTATEQAGHAVFRERCSLCHSDRTDVAVRGPALVSVLKRPLLPSGAPATEAQVRATIVHGRNNMPAQGGQLTGSDLDDLLAYLHTL